MKTYCVIGLGLFGREIAQQLYEKGKNVMVIDQNSELIETYANKVSRAVMADAKKRDVLRQLGVDKCDCAILGMTSDLATSVLITMNLKALGVPEIICKVQNETDKEVLETLGATQVIIPEKLAADKLCRKIMHPNLLDYIELTSDYVIIELQAPSAWVNHSILETNVRAKYGVNIIAVKRDNKLNMSFDAGYVITAQDTLVMIGDDRSLNRIQKMD